MSKIPFVLSALFVAPLSATDPVPTTPSSGIEWTYGSLDDAIASSTQKSGLTLIYFWADGSEFCGKLYTETLSNDTAAKAVDGFVCYSAKHSSETAELFERYKVRTLPTMLVVRADGQPEDIITGFISADDFADEIARIRRAENTLTGLTNDLGELDPASIEGVEARWLLVGKLQELGLENEEKAHTEKIKQLDPEGNTEAGGQLRLSDLFDEALGDLTQKSQDEAVEIIKNADFGPIYAFAKGSECKPVRFAAWSSLARLEAGREDYVAARDAIMKSVADVGDEARAGWCNSVAGWAVNNAERISSKERKYALTLAEQSVKLTMQKRKKAKKLAKLEQKDGDDYELADDTLATRMRVLAQVEMLNRKREAAKKTIRKAAELAQSADVQKRIAAVRHEIEGDQ